MRGSDDRRNLAIPRAAVRPWHPHEAGTGYPSTRQEQDIPQVHLTHMEDSRIFLKSTYPAWKPTVLETYLVLAPLIQVLLSQLCFVHL